MRLIIFKLPLLSLFPGRIKVESESLFTYMEGLSLLSYSRPFYKPGFLDRKDLKFSNKALEVKARAACGSNIRCLFDIHTTSKVAIGIATKQATEEYAVLLQDTDSKGTKISNNKT